jgi:hypothetical protein
VFLILRSIRQNPSITNLHNFLYFFYSFLLAAGWWILYFFFLTGGSQFVRWHFQKFVIFMSWKNWEELSFRTEFCATMGQSSLNPWNRDCLWKVCSSRFRAHAHVRCAIVFLCYVLYNLYFFIDAPLSFSLLSVTPILCFL